MHDVVLSEPQFLILHEYAYILSYSYYSFHASSQLEGKLVGQQNSYNLGLTTVSRGIGRGAVNGQPPLDF